ncbi:RtcB family protein [bacterium SCSIO 12741]|nr:RtcB family protein [bacterium SCSIO 12741]
MGHSKIRGKDLERIRYHSDRSKSLAIEILGKHFKRSTKKEKLFLLQDVLSNPTKYLDDPIWSRLAEEFAEPELETPQAQSYELRDEPKSYRVYGKKFIDQMTLRQMDQAMSLPVAEKGALMPDAHVGYGLPVGGVLATRNAVIPYGVGLDIGCRMCMTVYDVPANMLTGQRHAFKNALTKHTHFGIGKTQFSRRDHEVFDRTEFQDLEPLRHLKDKAYRQIGTSGSGNHFVEFGRVEISQEGTLGIPPGEYLGILSHSGSRGFGASIAQYYTQLARDLCHLPKTVQHLAWLDLDTEPGQEYWLAMNLAGDYARACHDVIHLNLSRELGLRPMTKVENHHNFAWKEEQQNGESFVVHRKGATPAQNGTLGIIPGSMTAPGYIVSGKGVSEALQSASHGAGRAMSRSKARSSFTRSDMKKMLNGLGIQLIGGGVDEAPKAYKDLEVVMKQQEELVRVEGKFYPKIVRMDKG